MDSIGLTIELWIGNFFNLMISSVLKTLLKKMINQQSFFIVTHICHFYSKFIIISLVIFTKYRI